VWVEALEALDERLVRLRALTPGAELAKLAELDFREALRRITLKPSVE